MTAEKGSAKRTASGAYSAWPATTSTPRRTYQLSVRLIGIPIVAVAGVLIYSGLRDRFVLPACDSARAKSTLADVFKRLEIEPLRYAPLDTVSSSKAEIVCRAVLPLAGGADLSVDYSFFWRGNTAQMRYSISRREPRTSTLGASPADFELKAVRGPSIAATHDAFERK